jgi:hypothetical protein
MSEEQEKTFGKYLDLDAFIPPVEPSWITLKGKRYDVVSDIQTGTFMRVLKMEELSGEAANANLVGILNETIPSLPEDEIRKMTSKQLTGCLAFLIKLYMKGASDPNLLRPMLKKFE